MAVRQLKSLGDASHLPASSAAAVKLPRRSRPAEGRSLFARRAESASLYSVLQAKMAQQAKQMRLGACKCIAYRSLELVLLANGNRC
jgi:hypothetical protein